MKVLCFGDSLTAGTPGFEPGYGGDPRSQYGFWMVEAAKQEDFQELEFSNQGVPGELTSMMYSRLRRTIESDRFDIAVILGGSNDIGWGRESITIFAALQRLWNLCLDNDLKVIACTVPPIGSVYPPIQKAQNQLNGFIRESNSRDISVVDIFSVLSDSHGLLLPNFDSGDGLHLSVEGYRKVGEITWHEGLKQLVFQ